MVKLGLTYESVEQNKEPKPFQQRQQEIIVEDRDRYFPPRNGDGITKSSLKKKKRLSIPTSYYTQNLAYEESQT